MAMNRLQFRPGMSLFEFFQRFGTSSQSTLLKGISISEQYYLPPHHRAMSDIDILVPKEAFNAVEAEAKRLGNEQLGPQVTGPGHHHGEPLYHSERQTVLEIHTALFKEDSPLSQGDLFSPDSIARTSVTSVFRGRTVRRLTEEIQLVYIAAYWFAARLPAQRFRTWLGLCDPTVSQHV